MTGSATLRNSMLALLALALALAVVHPELVFSGKIYASADASAANAFASAGREAQREGEIPLWNPFVFGGMPSYASLAFLPDVYPLQKPLRVVVEALGLPPMTWMLFHVFLLGFGVALYLRWRGLHWAAALMAGLCCMVLPKVVAWGVHGHGTKIGTFAWLPWALWCLDAVLRKGSRVALPLFGAALSMMLLRYHVQIFYYCALALLIVGIAQLWASRGGRFPSSRVALLIAVALLALGTSAQIYMPVWEYQSLSVRGAAEQGGGAVYDYATNWSLAPAEMATFVWPTAFGYGSGSYVGDMPFTDYPNYLGLPLLLLAALSLLWRRGAFVWAWTSIALLSLLISFGKHGPVYDLFYHVAPFFNKFRVPSMILVLQQFAIVMLAAEGLDALLERWSSVASRPRQLVVIGCAAIGLIFLFVGTIGSEALRQDSIGRWQELRPQLPASAFASVAELARGDALRLGSLFAFASLTLGLSGAGWRRWLPTLLILLPFGDLCAVTAPIRHPEKHLLRPARSASGVVWVPSPSMLSDVASLTEEKPSPLADWLLQQEPRPRVWPVGIPELARSNELAARGIVNLGGYHAAKLRRSELLRERVFERNPPATRLVNMMGARWVILSEPLPEATIDAFERLGMRLSAEPVHRGAEGVVYENLSALPRARIADGYELATGQDEADFDRIERGGLDAGRVALLDGRPDPAPQDGASAAVPVVVDEGFDWVRLRAQLPQPGVLVLADPYYPGWSVRVDGRPRQLLRADVHLRAVALEAGEHEVVFRMDGGSYGRGRLIAGLSASILALLLLAAIALDRRARGSAA